MSVVPVVEHLTQAYTLPCNYVATQGLWLLEDVVDPNLHLAQESNLWNATQQPSHLQDSWEGRLTTYPPLHLALQALSTQQMLLQLKELMWPMILSYLTLFHLQETSDK